MSLGNITVELELNDKNFTVRTVKAGKTVKELGREFDRTTRSVRNIERSITGTLPKLRDLAITTSILKGGLQNLYHATIGWQKTIINTNAEIERMTFLLKGMSNATDDAGRVRDAADDIAYLFDMAERAPFSMSKMTDSLVKMRSVGLEDARGGLESITDAVAQFGGTDDILHRATIAIQQMAGKGVISMEELRQQLGEAVPTAIKLMARSMNMTYQELVDAISTGRVEAQDALQRMFREMDRTMGGSATQMMETWSGLVARLETRWTRFQILVGENKMFEEAKASLEKLVEAMDPNQVERYAQVWGEMLGTIIKNLTEAVEWILQHGSQILDVVATMAQLYIAYKALQGAIAIVTGLAAAKATLTAATLASAAAQERSGRFTARSAREKQNAAEKTRALARAMTGLGTAMRFLGGPWGIAIGLAVSLGASFVDLGGDIEKATDMLNKNTLALDENSQASMKNAIDQLASREIELRAEYERLKKRADMAVPGSKRGNRRSTEAYQLLKELEDNVQRQLDIEDRLHDSLERQQQNHNARRLDELNRALANENKDATAAYASRMDELQQLFDLGDIDQSQFIRGRVETIESFYDQQLDILRNKGVELAQAYAEAGELEQKAIIAQTDDLVQRSKELQALREREIQTAQRQARLLSRGSGQSRLENYFTQISAGIRQMEEDLAGGSTTLAKFETLLQKGFYGKDGDDLLGGGTVGGKNLEQLKAQLRLFDEMREKVKAARESERAVQDLESAYSSLAQQAESARKEFETGVDSSFIDGVNRDVDEMLKKIKEGTEGIEEMADAIRANAARRENFSRAADMAEETRRINDSLLTDRKRMEVQYERAVKEARARFVETERMSAEEVAKINEELYQYLEALQAEYVRNSETPMTKMLREWEDITGRMEQATANWLDDATDRMVDFATTGKFEFGDMVESILKDILRLQIQANISNALGASGGSIGSAIAGWLGGMGGGGEGGGGFVSAIKNLWPFADGGIMTSGGSLPLNKYANGGIANSPQLALYGEGRMPEAYVPLPDGRTIPVTLQGGGAQQAPVVQVNVINQTSQEVQANQGQSKFDGKRMILDVVMSAAATPGPFRDTLRGAVR